MAKDFHNDPFDDETKLKLEIFKGYIREWLPVFLSAKSPFQTINIFDFFAGPGKDLNGLNGSPLIIVDEINNYVKNPKRSVRQDVSIKLFLNDSVSNKITLLKKEIAQKDTESLTVDFTDQEFSECFGSKNKQDVLKSTLAAKLLVIDQQGVSEISPDIFLQLINYPATDFMFFISSSILRRFITTDEVGRHFPEMSSEEIKAIPSTEVHRFVCEYYKKLVPESKNFYIVPFSIKKGANIYGIIFGSGNLYGLEKFLQVCWNKDNISGEANYDIDDDIVRGGQTLFKEYNVPKKIDGFRNSLVDFIGSDFRSNQEIYKFTLDCGCLPKHAKEILQDLQKDGRIKALPSDIRKGSFYINWKDYGKVEPRAKFSMKE